MMKRKRAAASVLTAVVMVSSMGVSASGVYMKPVSTENADGAIYTYNSETDQYELLKDISNNSENIQMLSYLADLEWAIVGETTDAWIRSRLKEAGVYESTDSKYEIDSVEKYRDNYEYHWDYELLESEERDDGKYIVTISDSYVSYVVELEEGDEGRCRIISSDSLTGSGLIPNTVLGDTVVAVRGSVYTHEFDLDPENKYMKCVDNVIFSKDGKRLMAYACYDERETYTVPDGTEIIGQSAFGDAGIMSKSGYDDYYLTSVLSEGIVISGSVRCIEPYAFFNCMNIPKVIFVESDNHLVIEMGSFAGCDSLEEVILPSFDVEMDRSAFKYSDSLPTLTTYAQPTLTSEGTTIRWEEIEGATYYEVYQKLNDGEYRLLGTTSGGGCRFTTLKEGKEYTFAVKAYAEIPAANYDPETDEGVYPESFLIEGTMSEDIVLVG